MGGRQQFLLTCVVEEMGTRGKRILCPEIELSYSLCALHPSTMHVCVRFGTRHGSTQCVDGKAVRCGMSSQTYVALKELWTCNCAGSVCRSRARA